MLKKMIRNELKKSKLTSLSILFFIFFSALLLSSAGLITEKLFSSIDRFVSQSKAPDYLQMHMGDFDEGRMEEFARSHKKVKNYQTLPFLNIDNHHFLINGGATFENFQDNGFTVQSQSFDFLLDQNNEPIRPEPGQVYVPMTYFREGLFQKGDRIQIGDCDLEVMGPLRDAQMNSSLSSSKRFLVHEEDYKKLRPLGREEYLIEFLLTDTEAISAFQADYEKAGLESNGPAISAKIIRLINAITDGILVALLVLLSILVLIISLLCIRFTLLSKIEDEYREIGVLKAIGLRPQLLKKIYRAKIIFLAGLGSLSGFLAAQALSPVLLSGIEDFMGRGPESPMGLVISFCATLLIFLLVLISVRLMLRRIHRFTPQEAIRLSKVRDRGRAGRRFKLRKQSLSGNSFLGLSRLINRKKAYFLFSLILILSSFIILLPNHIYSSLASDRFVRYMGFGEVDVFMSLQDSESAEKDMNLLVSSLEKDDRIDDFSLFHNKNLDFRPESGEIGRLWTSFGDHDKFPVLYSQGAAPQEEDQIALSYLAADDLDVEIGQTINLLAGGEEKQVRLVGIYSDITNGGRTAKMTETTEESLFSTVSSPSLRTDLSVRLTDPEEVALFVQDYQDRFPAVKTVSIADYRMDYFGSSLALLKKLSLLAILLSVLLVGLITGLFTRLLVVRDQRDIAILKAMGFQNRQLKDQYDLAALIMVIVGIGLGFLLASSLGKSLAGMMIGGFGVSQFSFTINPLFSFILAPALMILVVLASSNLGLRAVEDIQIIDHIKE